MKIMQKKKFVLLVYEKDVCGCRVGSLGFGLGCLQEVTGEVWMGNESLQSVANRWR